MNIPVFLHVYKNILLQLYGQQCMLCIYFTLLLQGIPQLFHAVIGSHSFQYHKKGILQVSSEVL